MALERLYTPEGVGGGGGWVLNTISYGESLTRGPTLYLFIYHFWHKRYAFRIHVIEKWYPCHILLCNAV